MRVSTLSIVFASVLILYGAAVPAAGERPAMVEVTINSEGSRLPGHIYLAGGAGPHPTVVLLHGFPGNEKNLDIAQALRRDGFNVLFFHYRGAWGAEGDYSITGQPEDVAAALTFLAANSDRLRVDTAQLTLLGHSLGGYTALAAGTRNAVACVGAMAPANPAGYRRFREQGWVELDARLRRYADSLFMLTSFDAGVMRAELASAPEAAIDTRRFGEDLVGKSVLLVVGDEDEATPVTEVFRPIVDAYERVDGLALRTHVISGDHSFSWSRVELTGLLLEWLRADCR